jgi:uncharacterized protein
VIVADDYAGLIPPEFQQVTLVLLVRPPDAPAFTDEELDALQREHLTYLRDLGARGLILANGPFATGDDDRVRGLTVYSVEVEEARALAEADPMVRAVRLAIEARAWLTAAGSVEFPPNAWPRASREDQPSRT